VVEALARRGYAIGIHYRSSELEAAQTAAEVAKLSVPVVTLPADLTDEAAAKGMIGQLLDQFGRIDVLVNCAAAWSPKKLEDTTAEDVHFFFETNLLSAFICSQHAGLAMATQPEGGNIILIGDWAIERPYTDYAAYFASKGAIPTLTRVLAVELGARNPKVRVNCIHPGPVMLPDDLPEAEKQESIRGTLVKREGSGANIAQAVLALIENDFITGVCLPVDGGRTIYAP
jgi:pteridine reductase